ncbi:MAG TPA: SusE domain-containing protein [Chitinophagaceae bacterium]|nr:SusE domain-containing protein [Chitinophagaceae bacterium]
MKQFINKLLLVTGIILLISSCHKVADLPNYNNGEAVTLTPSKTTIAPTVSDSSNTVVSFSWTSPKYATDTSTYKFILEIDSTGRNFSKKQTKTVYGALATGLTGRELNNIVLNYGFALGTPYSMDVRVASSYTNNNEKYYSNTVKITVTPFNDPSSLTSTQTSVTLALATAAQASNTFSWSKSFTGFTGNVNYSLQYDSAGKNFVAPQEIAIGTNVYTRTLTQGEMNQTALSSGIPGGNSGKVEYRVKAVTVYGAVSYSNVVMVTIQSYLPILRFYLPGSYQAATGNGTDWDPPTAPELVRDLRASVFNDLYYIYIYLPAGAQFKVTQGRSWDVNYGGTGGNLAINGANFSVATAGVYRISINRTTLKYDIKAGRMGFVGGATGADWTPPNVFPAYEMGAPSTNVFVGITNFTTGGWKLIDNDQWNDGSNSVGETRSYGSAGGPGSAMAINGPNFPDVATAGRYRAIWDGRDVNNIKYEFNPATEMRLVGDGINQAGVNDWDPPTSPQMTYNGNGVWTITIALKANKSIKFLAGNAWGAFDYEDNSGQNAATGTPRKIKWDGGPDFKTPATAGTYTITLNEYAQTVTIN